MAKSLLPLSVSQESGDESVNEIISQLKSLLPFTASSSTKPHDQDALDIMQEAIFYIQDLNDILSESGSKQVESVPASPKL